MTAKQRKFHDSQLREVYAVLADTTIEHPISHLIREQAWEPMSAAQYVREAWRRIAAEVDSGTSVK